MFEAFINLLYPQACGFCNKICKEELCKKCELKVQEYGIINLDAAKISVFRYEDIIRKKIIEYKFGNKAYLYKTFAKCILKNEKICEIIRNYDIIIPVPIHRKRKARKRLRSIRTYCKRADKTY